MQIRNIIDRVADGKGASRDWEAIEGAMVHRVGVDLKTGGEIGYDGETIARAFIGAIPKFEAVAKVTGHQNAYTILIGGNLGLEEFDGVVWQALALDEVGYHGRRFSAPFIGIACIGDFRVSLPSKLQRNSLVDILVELCGAFGWDPYKKIKGHDEVPYASKDPNKECPGSLLAMNPLRDDVATIMKDRSRRRLFEAGLVFGRS